MVTNFIIIVALIILIGISLNVLVCHTFNDIKIEKWKRARREYLYGTGYTEKDIDESVRY